MSNSRLQCIEPACGANFDIREKLYTCPTCGGLLDIAYEFDNLASTSLKRVWLDRRQSDLPVDASGVWRYRELIPFVDDISNVVTLREGNTPVYEAPKSASYAGLQHLMFKHQGMNPTGSFKDNGMTTGATQARVLRAKTVACASTGNTSASMAAYAVRAGMTAAVFIPGGQISFGKLSQSLEYGATTLQIDGDFDDAMKLVIELSRETDLYLLNSINPFRLEGQKTIAIELLDQLNWQVPDSVVLPGGNLGNVSAIGKGFKELLDLGFIDRMPRLTVIQAKGANPLIRMLESKNDTLTPMTAHTLATAIKIGNPVSWKKAVRALEWTNGNCTDVTEEEIADAKAMIGRDGIGCEPASATTLAGIKKLIAQGVIDKGENVVAILTGNLMKDPGYSIDYHLGELFEEKTTKTENIQTTGKISGNFANPPKQVSVDKEKIKKMLGL